MPVRRQTLRLAAITNPAAFRLGKSEIRSRIGLMTQPAMQTRRPIPRTVPAAAGLALAAILWSGTAWAAGEPVRDAAVSFGIYTLGAKGIEIGVTMKRAEADVVVDTSMRSAGVLDWALRFTLTGQTAARQAGSRFLPVTHRSDSDGTWSKRMIRMRWGADGLPQTELHPPIEQDDREPVPEALKANTLDPTTAMIARVLRSGAEPPCTGSDPIFDGRRRYTMHFTAVGPEQLEPHNRSAYSGPAFKCMIRVEPIAGYTRAYLAGWSERDEQPTYLWLARPQGFDAWLPVRMEGGSRLGTASGFIASARINGRDWLKPLGPIRAELPRETTP